MSNNNVIPLRVTSPRRRPPIPVILSVVLIGLLAVSFGATALGDYADGYPVSGTVALVGVVGAVFVVVGLWRGNRFAHVVVVAYAAVGIALNVTSAYLLEPGRTPLEFGTNVLLLGLLLVPRASRAHFLTRS